MDKAEIFFGIGDAFDMRSIEMVECSTSLVKCLTKLTNRAKCQKIVNTIQKT